jgi:hypothetical protein
MLFDSTMLAFDLGPELVHDEHRSRRIDLSGLRTTKPLRRWRWRLRRLAVFVVLRFWPIARQRAWRQSIALAGKAVPSVAQSFLHCTRPSAGACP